MTEITYEKLTRAADIALKTAEAMHIPVTIVFLDADTRLRFLYRDPEALLVSLDLAQTKAYSAYALKMDTIDIGKATAPGAPLQALEASAKGTITAVGGGLPFIDSCGRLLGAVGVSGAADPKDDRKIAAVFLAGLMA
ncbi:MAG: heme-binding protein [Lachnospiraceae bacterium]|nr:heme-binding protein [Lachnospiraceae bacterium]